MRTKVQVRNLQSGDVLGSLATVIRTFTSISTPPGKMEVEIKYFNGKQTCQTWNRSTTVTVQNR